MRRSAILLALALVACGESSDDAPSGSGGDSGVADAPADAPDFSALDPALCPPATPEDFLGFDSTVTLAASASTQQDKSFYLLTLIDTTSAARAAVVADATLSALATQRAQALSDAKQTCAGEVTCLGAAAKWSDADITSVGDALVALPELAPVSADLRRSGTAMLHAGGSDNELLRAAWQDAAHALNDGWSHTFATLPANDRTTVLDTALALKPSEPFYAPLLSIVLDSLLADGRDEATRYEPLTQGENQAALAHLASIDFDKYPFGIIVVPGLGPTDLDTPLSPGGQTRADQAAARFAAGLAPLIMLSGGHVHPDRTPYSEAIEMKKYLMQAHDLPEDVLLVDPHARHTTTNLRNVARELYRYGIPVDRPALITSDFGQTLYIAATSDAAVFGKRCLAELGYKPWRGITRLDDLDNCWLPTVESLHQDARDLLDP